MDNTEIRNQNFLNWNNTVAISSYNEVFKIGDVVRHEGAKEEEAVVEQFKIDEESEDVLVITDKGYCHLDFIYFPKD